MEVHYYHVALKRNELRAVVDRLEIAEKNLLTEALMHLVPDRMEHKRREIRDGIIRNVLARMAEWKPEGAHTTAFHAKYCKDKERHLIYYMLDTVKHISPIPITHQEIVPLAYGRYVHYTQMYLAMSRVQIEAQRKKNELDRYVREMHLPLKESLVWTMMLEVERVPSRERSRYVLVNNYGAATRSIIKIKEKAMFSHDGSWEMEEWQRVMRDIDELRFYFNLPAVEEYVNEVLFPWALERPIADYERIVPVNPINAIQAFVARWQAPPVG